MPTMMITVVVFIIFSPRLEVNALSCWELEGPRESRLRGDVEDVTC